MCGIAAALGKTGAIHGLVRSLRHRGPDHAGALTLDRVALGATRLAINGGASGDQPFTHGSVTCVANGEIFNYRDLGWEFPECDVEPLVRALATDWDSALSTVRGPIALAAYDRVRREVLLARDESGLRPLHVYNAGGVVLAASEIWPLVDAARSRLRIDQDALAHLLAFQFLPPGRTLFESIRSVRPGEAWIVPVEAGTTRPARTIPVRYRGDGAERPLRDLLRESASLQGDCPVKSAVFLSGGMDSSAVLGLLSETGRKPDLAIVGWFPDSPPEHDERPHARAVAKEVGIELVEVAIDARLALAALPPVVRSLGGPQAGPGSLAQYVLASEARARGVRVVFTGEGGDELFGGYERHAILRDLEAGDAPDPLGGYEPLAQKMERDPNPLAAAIFRGAALRPFLDDELARRVAGCQGLLPARGPGYLDRVLEFEFERFLPGLLAADDATLAAFGIEGRAPLLDPLVSRAARALPYSEKSQKGARRKLFREVVGSALPIAAANRTDKLGFPMPLAAWMSGPWRGEFMDRLARSPLSDLGLRPEVARAAFERGQLEPRTAWFLLSLDHFARLSLEAHKELAEAS